MATYFKCTRPDGTDFHGGTIDYAAALASGEPLVVAEPDPASVGACGRGLHVCATARQTIGYADRNYRPWRWFEVTVTKRDIVASDHTKTRVRRLYVVRELFLADVFGADFAERIQAVKAEVTTWKKLPWLKPTTAIGDSTLEALFAEWHKAVSPWLSKGEKLPAKMKIVRTHAAAVAAVAVAADAVDAAAVAVDAAVAAVDAAAKKLLPRWPWWYIRPYFVLRRWVRWHLVGMEQPNPWRPLLEMFKLGALPIGYSNGAFVIYAPEPKKAAAKGGQR